MKKFIFSLLAAIMCFTAVGCGGFLLFGCGSSQVQESDPSQETSTTQPTEDKEAEQDGSTSAAATSGWWTSYTSAFTSGSGTSSSPYLISTPQQLAYLASQLRSGTTYASKYYKLNADIDLSGHWWTPIGRDYAFTGDFNGNNHIIRNMWCHGSSVDDSDYRHSSTMYYGLFGRVWDGANIHDLLLDGATIDRVYSTSTSYSMYAGLIAADVYATSYDPPITFTNVGVLGGQIDIETSGQSGDYYVGGLFGSAYADFASYPDGQVYIDIQRCFNAADIYVRGGTTTTSTRGDVGGLAGQLADANVEDCFAYCNINSNYESTGGLFGYFSLASIYNSYFASSSTCYMGSGFGGGIYGTTDGYFWITNCFMSASLSQNKVSGRTGYFGMAGGRAIGQGDYIQGFAYLNSSSSASIITGSGSVSTTSKTFNFTSNTSTTSGHYGPLAYSSSITNTFYTSSIQYSTPGWSIAFSSAPSTGYSTTWVRHAYTNAYTILNDSFPILSWVIKVLDSKFITSMTAGSPVTYGAPTGSGTSSSPYQINSLENLLWMQRQIAIGNTTANSAYYKLIANITIPSGYLWVPIGGFSYYSGSNSGKFSFDGNGYTISNVNIICAGKSLSSAYYIRATVSNSTYPTVSSSCYSGDKYLGLFSCMGSGTIQNLYVDNVNIKIIGARNTVSPGNIYCGGLIGYLGTIGALSTVLQVGVNHISITVDCAYNPSGIPGTCNVGGLIGDASVFRLERSYVYDLTVQTNTTSYSTARLRRFGGLLGYVTQDSTSTGYAVKDCFVSITSSTTMNICAYENAGGICGNIGAVSGATATLLNCYFYSNAPIYFYGQISGGLIGEVAQYGYARSCFVDAKLTFMSGTGGVFAGFSYSNGAIISCSKNTSVLGGTSYADVGGSKTSSNCSSYPRAATNYTTGPLSSSPSSFYTSSSYLQASGYSSPWSISVGSPMGSATSGTTWVYRNYINGSTMVSNVNGGFPILRWSANKFRKTVTVSFSSASGSYSSRTYELMSQYNSTWNGSSYVTSSLPVPIRAGYSFKGWYTSSTGGTQVTNTTLVTNPSNHTLYAQWITGVYTISFNVNGGSGSPKSLYYQYGTASLYSSGTPSSYTTAGSVSGTAYSNGSVLPSSYIPTRSGFAFAGYFSAASGGTQYVSSSGTIQNLETSTFSSNKMLYAHWTGQNTLSVTMHIRKPGGTTFSTTNCSANFVATPYNAYGSLDTNCSVTWTSGNTAKIGSGSYNFQVSSIASGYTVIGITDDENPPASYFDTTNLLNHDFTAKSGTNTIHVWVQQNSSTKPLDSTGNYYTFTDGTFPQTEVTDQAIKNGFASASKTNLCAYFDAKGNEIVVQKATYNGVEYAGLNIDGTVRVFKFEPIEWRASTVFNCNGKNYYTVDSKYFDPNKFTINIWAFMPDWSKLSDCGLVGIEGGVFRARFDSSGYLTFEFGSGESVTSSSCKNLSNGWHMFTVAKDTSLYLYIDGKLVGVGSAPKEIVYPVVPITVGNSKESSTGIFPGSVKGFYISKSVWNDERIYEEFNRPDDEFHIEFSPYSQYATVRGDGRAVTSKVIAAGAMVYGMDEVRTGNDFIPKAINYITNYFTDNCKRAESMPTWTEVYSADNTQDVVSYYSREPYAYVATYGDISAAGVGTAAELTDFAAAILGATGGTTGDYWTSSLGAYKNGLYVTADGEVRQDWLNQVHGMRMMMNVKEAYIQRDTEDFWTDAGNYAEDMSGGTGTPDDPFLISNAKQLALLSYSLSSYAGSHKWGASSYKLTADIDLAAHEWVPIGAYYGFSGSFDGDYHVIKNMRIDYNYEDDSYGRYQNEYTSLDCVGLFGELSESASVKNLLLKNVNIKVDSPEMMMIGAIAGISTYTPTIMNVGVLSGTIEITDSLDYQMGFHVGGLIGSNEGKSINIIKCFSNMQITTSIYDPFEAACGGLLGYTIGTDKIIDSYFKGSLYCEGDTYLGGLVGRGEQGATINLTNCYFKGEIDSQSYYLPGGLVGGDQDGTTESTVIILGCFVTIDTVGYEGYLWEAGNDGDIDETWGFTTQDKFNGAGLTCGAAKHTCDYMGYDDTPVYQEDPYVFYRNSQFFGSDQFSIMLLADYLNGRDDVFVYLDTNPPTWLYYYESGEDFYPILTWAYPAIYKM